MSVAHPIHIGVGDRGKDTSFYQKDNINFFITDFQETKNISFSEAPYIFLESGRHSFRDGCLPLFLPTGIPFVTLWVRRRNA